MICAASVCTVAPGGDLGCQVYVAGDTLVRREKREVKLRSPDCVFRLYDLVSLCIYVMYVMVYLGDGSGIAVMPSVPILVVCITN